MGHRRVVVFLVLLACAVVPGSAFASISGTVYMDYNSNGVLNVGGYVTGASASVTATDVGVAGITVSAYDATGTRVGQTTSGADGTYTLTTSTAGAVRVEFSVPSGYESSFRGSQSDTSVQFVSTDASSVNFALGKAVLYCQDNPQLVTCQMPLNGSMSATGTNPGARVVPTAIDRSMTLTKAAQVQATAGTASTQTTTAAPGEDLGAVYGVGVDRQRNAFFGTYVKRHSPYGPGSDGTNGATNWIYRVNLDNPGRAEAFIRLGINTLPAHSSAAPTAMGSQPAYAADGNRNLSPGQPGYSDVYSQVGRAGLGDLDVTPDGSTLLAVEMTESDPKLWVVPLAGTGNAVTAGTPTAHSIPAPTTFNGSSCVGTWHPMAIGIRETTILVGGVCGAEATVTTGTDTTQAVAFVLSFDRAAGTFTTVAALPMSYWRAKANTSTAVAMGRFQPSGLAQTGMWHNWNDSAPPSAVDINNAMWAKPMLSDIEIGSSGELTLAFRDRYMDQENPANTIIYESSLSSSPAYIDFGMALGDVIRMCLSNGAYVMENDGTCNGIRGATHPTILDQDLAKRPNSPLFFFSGYAPWHAYNNLGGLANLPGSRLFWSSVWDVDDWYQLGVMAFGPCPDRAADSGSCGPVPSGGSQEGSIIGGVAFGRGGYALGGRPPASEGLGTGAFRKGNGLGDLEIVCDAAPVQIGNRVWIDTDKDGIQDPGEAVVAGVTVHLYDASGTLVGTAITDASGSYYFSSNVSKPAAGDGSNAGGGLVAGAAFKVKLDNPADYAAGGALNGYSLTTADVATQGTAVNSKATKVGGYPTIDIPSRTAGQNNHTFDVGFYRSASDLVAIGDYTWIDTNRNGVQDAGEKPLKGVRVTLLTPDGKRAKDAAGKVVPIKRTDAKGYYVFDGLKPGRYKVQFLLPSGYRFTSASKGSTKKDSNPRAASDNPLRGITPVFRVYASVKGNTIRNRNPKVNASFIDPTIDAGVVRYMPAPVPSPVTG